MRTLDGAERLAAIAPGSLSWEALRALLTGTALGELLEDLEALAADRTAG